MRYQLRPIDASAYVRHPIHGPERTWTETNCAVDLWVEVLHAWNAEPIAALPFTLAVDFEGDQWTFFKFPLDDLGSLYGVDVIELTIWHQLVGHVEEQLQRGRLPIVEVDAFYLPDTAATSYRREHVKSSIGIQALDRSAGWLGYFHNRGYFELQGDDFKALLRLTEDTACSDILPPYVEAAKLPARSRYAAAALVSASIDRLRVHLERAPADNPFRRYQTRLSNDLTVLSEETLEYFHRYAFATMRQCGAAFELAATYLRWLQANGERGLEPLAESCDAIAGGARTLQFRTARVVQTRRPFDSAALIDPMAQAWDRIMSALTERYGAVARAR
jgi:hypothetical protein